MDSEGRPIIVVVVIVVVVIVVVFSLDLLTLLLNPRTKRLAVLVSFVEGGGGCAYEKSERSATLVGGLDMAHRTSSDTVSPHCCWFSQAGSGLAFRLTLPLDRGDGK